LTVQTIHFNLPQSPQQTEFESHSTRN